MESIATKAKRATRDAARYRDARPTSCVGCGATLTQPARGRRLYCTDACRWRSFYRAHPGYGYVPVTPVPPMPMPYVGDPVFDEARRAAHLTSTDYSADWGQSDILGVATLAILQGTSPRIAVYWHRKWERDIEQHRVYAYDIGWDGRRIIVQRYGDEDSEDDAA